MIKDFCRSGFWGQHENSPRESRVSSLQTIDSSGNINHFQSGAFSLLWLLILMGGMGCYSRSVPMAETKKVADMEKTEKPWFEDITDAIGLDFVHDPGPTGDYFMPQANGSGCGLIYENDDIYLYLVNNAGPDSKSVNRLYKKSSEGKFMDVTAGSGLDVAGYGQGVAVGDVNNDGLPDVVLTQYRGVRLFINEGKGKFREITELAGLANPWWGASAAFLDYDRDGWLDLVVTNYVDYDPSVKCRYPAGVIDFCGPNRFKGSPARLFRNLGPVEGNGVKGVVRYSDVSESTGIANKTGPGLGVLCADFNGDGWSDIFISNDEKPNHLWISHPEANGKITFKEEAQEREIAVEEMGKSFAGMGIALGDMDNKGMFDLFVTHLGTETHTLWKQESRGRFKDRTVKAGLLWMKWRGTGFGTLMADFNLDGYVDLAIVNGGVARKGPAQNTGLGFWEGYAERNQILGNDGQGRFRDLSLANPEFSSRWNVGRGLACGDLDGDGAPDLLVTSIGDRARIYKSIKPEKGHWLKIRAIDPKWNRDAYGAEVKVYLGKKIYLRLINPAESFLSSSSPIASFGLGQADRFERIVIRWPDGDLDQSEEEFEGGEVNRTIVLQKGKGRPIRKP